MGLLNMKDYERSNYSNYILEAARLLGQAANIYQVSSNSIDLNQDSDPQYLDPVSIHFLLENNPRPILKKLNWYTEDDELPYVGYLVPKNSSNQLIEIAKDSIVEILPDDNNPESPKKFTITDIRSSNIDRLYFICKLVPYRYKSEITINTNLNSTGGIDTDYKYVKKRSGSR